jgi:hypothetical protein
MPHSRRRIGALGALLLAGSGVAGAQAASGRPATVTRTEFRQLRWLEGAWRSTREGQRPTFERYSVMNDSTYVIQYLADSSLTSTRGTALLRLRKGRLYQVSGQSRWIATTVRANPDHVPARVRHPVDPDHDRGRARRAARRSLPFGANSVIPGYIVSPSRRGAASMSKSEDEQMAKLVRKITAKAAAKPKKNLKRQGDPTLPPETTDEDLERRDFFKEMKKREF